VPRAQDSRRTAAKTRQITWRCQVNRTCRNCGAEFSGSRHAKNCPPCRKALHVPAKVVACLHCGGRFKKSQGGGNSKGLFCSRRCFGLHVRKRNAPRREEAKRKRDAARRRHEANLRRYREERAAHWIQCCTECGGPVPLLRGFGVKGGSRVSLCGARRCRAKRTYRRQRDRRRTSGTGTCTRHAVRARRHGLPRQYGKCMTLQSIGGRDGWICGICCGPIYERRGSMEPQSPCVDHIVPLAFRGNVTHGHTPDNVQIAHRSCNTAKGCTLQDPSLLDAISPLRRLRSLQKCGKN
jgi:hypothetical protein